MTSTKQIQLGRAFLTLLLCCSGWAVAQTGQALIGNPLLSPEKIKEVRRQIAEAAHKDAAPPPPAPQPAPAPAPMPQPQMSPAAMMGGGFPSPPNSEATRQSLSRLQVMTVVGDMAILAAHAPNSSGAGQMLQPAPMQQMGMPGIPPGSSGPQVASPAPSPGQTMRRTSSVTVRHQEPTLIEGVEVIPIIKGDSVWLTLKAAPREIVYSGAMQPAAYSPPSMVATSELQKTSTEYLNGVKPDTTSMSMSPGAFGAHAQQQMNQPVLPIPAPQR